MRKIKSIRGMERRSLYDHYKDIAAAIKTALDAPEEDLPRRPRGARRVVSPMLASSRAL